MALNRGSSAETVSDTMPPTGHATMETTVAGDRRRGRDLTRRPAAGEPRRRLRGRLSAQRWQAVPVVAVAAIVFGAVMDPSTFPTVLRVPAGREIEEAFDAFLESGTWLYEPIATLLETSFDSLVAYLGLISAPVFVAAVVLLVGYFKGVRLGLLAVAMFSWVILTGLWETTLETVSFMVVSVAVSSILGIAVGLLAATNPRVNAAVRLGLDAMQAFPAFAYLVPVVFLFGIGNAAALVVTVIWAMPPIARMTSVGLRNVSTEVVEAGLAQGASRWQLLRGVKFPMAAPSIRAGLNQTVMYAVAMATLAAMIGAAGLGEPVWSGLRRLEFGDALEGGIALVLVAILIDRASTPRSPDARRGSRLPAPHEHHVRRLLRRPSGGAMTALAGFLTVLTASQVLRGPWQNFIEPPWGTPLELREPVGSAVLWMTTTWGPTIDAVGSAIQQQGLNPLGELYASIPWFVVVLSTVIIGMLVAGKVKGVVLGVGAAGIGCLGMWTSTAATLAVVTTAIVLVLLVGFPLGVLMSASNRAAAMIRPILDVMQTLPVYLFVIPAVMLLGTGEVAAVLATLLAALPPVIRYTNTALRGVDPEVVEAAVTFGATPRQVLRQVRIPLGLQTIMVGLNQAVLLALAMAVVSAMIGAPGLGQDILASVERLNLARGIEAGLAMFLLAMILDRLFDGSARMLTTITHTSVGRGKAES
jgi:glycine betaine/proline transport system permease protein